MSDAEAVQPNVFATPDPPKQIGNVLTDWARSTETTEHRRLREFVLYLMVVKNGEG